MGLRLLITLCLLFSSVNPVYAIPPPETLALLGGGIVYPGLLLLGALTVFLKYIWVRTKLYLFWRLYLNRIFCGFLVLILLLSIPIFDQWLIINNPVSAQTIKQWLHSDSKPIFIDLRDTNSFEKVHLVGAINFPAGEGLTHYLRNNPDKNIILYCDVGLRSANLSFLDVDKSLLKQTLDANRLFYFPGGMHELMRLGEQISVPFVLNISSAYANYLLKKPNFTEIKFSDDKSSTSTNQFIAEYEKITANHRTPIIISDLPADLISAKLRQLHVSRLYVTTSTQTQPYPFNNFLLVLFILSATLFTIRRQELYRGIVTQPSTAYKWRNALLTLILAFPAIKLGLSKIPVPFDLDLYQITTGLPMNVGYLIAVYTSFGLIFLIHLVYTNRKRLHFLQQKLSNVFAPAKYIHFWQLPTCKELLIVFGIVYVLYKLCIPLPAVFLLSLFLSAPILVDLWFFTFLRTFKNTPRQVFNVLKRCGYTCVPDGLSFIQLNTHNESALARINITIDNESANLGLFTAEILDDSNGLKDKNLSETALMNYGQMVRNLLIFFQHDLELNLDREGNIISVRLYHNHTNARIINRHTLLKHYQILPGTINENRFTSTVFQEVFANPTPLMLDVLKLRWDKNGGCLKALHKLGILIKYNDKTQDQFIALSHQIYLDQTFEQAVFSTNRFFVWIRKKVSHLRFQLAIDSILQDYYTLIAPRTQARLEKLNEYLHEPQSLRKLKRIVNCALSTLYKESAMWQCYSSLLHQHAFLQLKTEATKASRDLSQLINYPTHLSPAYYELSEKQSVLHIDEELKKLDNCSYWQNAFLKTEIVRTYVRQFQLKEWQLISQLLEKLSKKLMLPKSLVYLTKQELATLASDRGKILNLLEYRYEAWQIQNQWHFSPSFSLRDLEQLPPSSTEHQDTRTLESHAIRVAGNQRIVTGNAVIFRDNLRLDTLPKGSILIADNLLPEQIIACQHINGIILKKGGYLSHTSILAREKNILLIAQFKTGEIKDKAKIMIHSGTQVMLLSNKTLEWEFIEGIATTSAIGNKALRLAMMSQKGFNIPATIILKHHAVEKIHQLNSLQANPIHNDNVWPEYYLELKQIVDILTQIRRSIIVRSSTNLEDSSHYSYAGIFYSQPNINSVEELISSISASWQNVSDCTEVIKHYSGETQVALNLIVQSYIKGQFGGVLFTESSTPGLMHVEIAPGGAEGVTQGNTALTSLYIDDKGHPVRVIGEKNSLSNEEYQVLYRLGRELETLFGKPQDIEWVLADQQFYIIQSRDIGHTYKPL